MTISRNWNISIRLQNDGSYGDEYYHGAVQEDEKHLLQSLFATVSNHWFLIVSLNLLVMALTIVYVAQQPNYYQAGARVQVNTEINPALGA